MSVQYYPKNKVVQAKVYNDNEVWFSLTMNEAAFQKCLEFKILYFYSKAKNRTEVFGEDYGVFLKVKELRWNEDKSMLKINIEKPLNHQRSMINDEVLSQTIVL